MRIDPRSPQGRDPLVTRLLRDEYAAPTDPAYWTALERRILSRIVGAGRPAVEWWEVFAGWTRGGLVAASIAAAAAAAAMFQTRAAEARVAYEAVVETPPVLPGSRVLRTAGVSEREATLRYVTAY